MKYLKLVLLTLYDFWCWLSFIVFIASVVTLFICVIACISGVNFEDVKQWMDLSLDLCLASTVGFFSFFLSWTSGKKWLSQFAKSKNT